MPLSTKDALQMAEQCNVLLATIEEMRVTVVDLSHMLPSTESLKRLSALRCWCDDAKYHVTEIKSFL